MTAPEGSERAPLPEAGHQVRERQVEQRLALQIVERFGPILLAKCADAEPRHEAPQPVMLVEELVDPP